MNSSQVVQYALSGVTAGSIYAIVAIGFNIIYNTTGIVNFAQGEFVILGAMLAITFSAFMPLAFAVLLAVIVTALIGGLLELVFIRRFRHASPLRLIMITIGLSIVLREGMLHLWDETVRSLPYFTGTSASTVSLAGARISLQVLWVLGISAVIVVVLSLFFKRTLTGQAMRACSDDAMAARLCGISDRWLVTLSFVLSAGIGALAGCVISPVTQTQYDMGAGLAIKGFTVAILGGLGNSMAAVAAGLLLGLVEAAVMSQCPVEYKQVVAIIVLLLVLVFKPTGLFARKVAGAR
jgi:branched-chain amino acid transport system permease protein